MSQIDVIRESIRYEQLLREGLTNQPLKGEHLLRDSQYPDMKEVLGVDAKATITNKEIVGDKVMVEGNLDYIVFYVSKEEAIMDAPTNKIHAVVFNDKFSNYVDLNNDEHNTVCNVECEIEHIEANWMNERKVGIDGLLTLRWEIYKNGEFEYVKDIEGKEDIQTKKEDETLNGVKGEKDIDLMGKSMLKATMDKPEIDEILKCNMNLHKKEVKVVEGKVYVGCYCKVSILYKGKDNKELETLEDDVYLSKEEEVPGITSDMLSTLDLVVAEEQHAVNSDDVGENRVVNIEFVVKGSIKVYSNEKVEILKDAYSPTMNIEIENGKKEFTLIHSIVNSEVTTREIFDIENKEDRVEKIVASTGQPLIKDKVVEDERVKVEGTINVCIIYKVAGEELNYGILTGNIPFNSIIDVRGLKKDMNVVVKPYLENMDTNIEGNAISVKATVGLGIKSYYKVNKDFIKDVVEGAEGTKEKKASVIIYVVGDGETLWDLAKKYNTTVAELERLNDINEDQQIKAGCKLIIPGRALF
ncbi:SPOCS domain-containing protein [uncultured Clostridium sp.]|uniref:SPOCS domain-containing protein n=1 Tax=uncultured Clostridium sp. TaxID=59620 RepID=UPI0025880F73|nr:SPOCS domain-containing protein [uncultured Clostridium sp.]